MRYLLLAALIVTGLAGCLDDSEDDDGRARVNGCPLTSHDPAGIRIREPTDDPIVDDFDERFNFDTTNVRTCSLPAIGWTPLSPDGVPHRYIGEMDMRGDLNLGAVAVLGNGEDSKVYVLDITDRADPHVLSIIEQNGVYIADVKFSDDGEALYTASQTLPLDADLSGLLTTEPTPFAGFTAYDITDPSSPQHIGAAQDPTIGCHMLEPVEVGPQQDAVYCISMNLRGYLVDRSTGTMVNLGFSDYVSGTPPQPNDVPAVGDPTCTLPSPLPNPEICLLASSAHDMTVYHDDADGADYMVVSHWNEGARVVDLATAPAFLEVGAWTGEGATHYDGNVHTAVMFRVGDDRYIAATPEYTYGGQVPSLWILDANDLSNMQLVGEWFHPGEHASQGLYLTLHQWQVAPRGPDVSVEEVRFYITYNHAGVWVLDMASILAGDNEAAILGYNLARSPLDPETVVGNAALSTWDVNVVDGYIYGTDRATGLWIFHYEGDTLGDERLRGYA